MMQSEWFSRPQACKHVLYYFCWPSTAEGHWCWSCSSLVSVLHLESVHFSSKHKTVCSLSWTLSFKLSICPVNTYHRSQDYMISCIMMPSALKPPPKKGKKTKLQTTIGCRKKCLRFSIFYVCLIKAAEKMYFLWKKISLFYFINLYITYEVHSGISTHWSPTFFSWLEKKTTKRDCIISVKTKSGGKKTFLRLTDVWLDCEGRS